MSALIWIHRNGYRTGGGFAVHQCDGVHAVAQSSWRRSVFEDMSQMRATACTRNFHPKDRRRRAAFADRFFADRLPETRPACARVEFRLCAVERIAARRANVNAVAVIESVAAQRR